MNWRKLGNALLTGMAGGLGKVIVGLLVSSFLVVLLVVPQGRKLLDHPVGAVAERVAERAPQEPTQDAPVTVFPPMLPTAPDPWEADADEWPADSVAVCAGLSAWAARHAGDSLAPALQRSLDRLRARCDTGRDSVADH